MVDVSVYPPTGGTTVTPTGKGDLLKKSTTGRVIAAALAVLTLVLAAPISASAVTWRYTTPTDLVLEYQIETSGGFNTPMRGGSGYLLGGGGWDATFHIRNVNANLTTIGGSTAAGWIMANFTHVMTNNLQGRCFWSSALYSGSDGLGMDCRYENNNQGTRMAPPASPLNDTGQPNLAVLESGAAATLPEAAEALPLDAATVKLASASQEANYYVARGEDGSVCLVAVLNDGTGVSGSLCTDSKTFNERGIAGSIESSASQTTMYLVPDVNAEVRETGNLERLTANLFVSNPGEARQQVASQGSTIAFEDGTSFDFPHLGE